MANILLREKDMPSWTSVFFRKELKPFDYALKSEAETVRINGKEKTRLFRGLKSRNQNSLTVFYGIPGRK